MKWRISEPTQLLGAIRVALQEGGRFLVSRLAPNGPILKERLLSYIHKATWGMYAAGVDHGIIERMLDWAAAESLQPNGDFYFPQEGIEYRDYQRVYRPLTFLRIGALIGHPIVKTPGVIDRICQYQHGPSGGAFNFIGNDPKHPEPTTIIGVLNTVFFGRFMLDMNMRDRAIAAGDWVRHWVDANRPHLREGRLMLQATPGGELVTDVAPGERIAKVLDYSSPRQEFWHPGVAIAYLASLYDAMRSRWNEPEERARPYLDACWPLLDFDYAMPLDTYLWPSKCKAGWGAGELMRVLAKYNFVQGECPGFRGAAAQQTDRPRPDAAETGRHSLPAQVMEKAYHVAERTALFTFMDNQLADGGWPAMHYPLNDLGEEMHHTYKPLKGIVGVPPGPLDGKNHLWLPGEEITGEFLGEMRAIEEGVAAWVKLGKGC